MPLTRRDLQGLARTRLREAKSLLAAGHSGGAYYLAGFAVECALKACIAKRTRRHEFPEKKEVLESYTHDLSALLRAARLEAQLRHEGQIAPHLQGNWNIVTKWQNDSRYASMGRQETQALFTAITDPIAGVLPLLTQYW